MGVVYRARQHSLSREVVIKVMDSQSLENLELSTRRMKQEIKILLRLSHPNLVRIFDADWDRQPPYMVLELVEGARDLAHILWFGGLALPTALEVIRQVGRGLGHLHRNGVLHRDLKPANVLYGRDGVARIIDFGLARRMASDATRLTLAGETLGSLPYMAPEQLFTSNVDARADLYAFGLVAYELLANRPVFSGRSKQAVTVNQRLAGDIPLLRSLNPGVDERWERALIRLLAVDPDRRPRTVEDFMADVGIDPGDASGVGPAPGPSPGIPGAQATGREALPAPRGPPEGAGPMEPGPVTLVLADPLAGGSAGESGAGLVPGPAGVPGGEPSGAVDRVPPGAPARAPCGALALAPPGTPTHAPSGTSAPAPTGAPAHAPTSAPTAALVTTGSLRPASSPERRPPDRPATGSTRRGSGPVTGEAPAAGIPAAGPPTGDAPGPGPGPERGLRRSGPRVRALATATVSLALVAFLARATGTPTSRPSTSSGAVLPTSDLWSEPPASGAESPVDAARIRGRLVEDPVAVMRELGRSLAGRLPNADPWAALARFGMDATGRERLARRVHRLAVIAPPDRPPAEIRVILGLVYLDAFARTHGLLPAFGEPLDRLLPADLSAGLPFPGAGWTHVEILIGLPVREERPVEIAFEGPADPAAETALYLAGNTLHPEFLVRLDLEDRLTTFLFAPPSTGPGSRTLEQECRLILAMRDAGQLTLWTHPESLPDLEAPRVLGRRLPPGVVRPGPNRLEVRILDTCGPRHLNGPSLWRIGFAHRSGGSGRRPGA